MTRTDDDTWDLANGVGATATGVAVGRALAGRAPNPLIHDPFAEPLVRAVGVNFFTRLASGELDPATVDDNGDFGMVGLGAMMGLRTRFFDDFFVAAGAAGIRQAVILASGLDARAYRLPWPGGTTVFEIDQSQVIEFKSATLAELGATPTADRRAVPVDLRHDWPAALRAAGLDPGKPTAWSAEGLMPFLPPEAQDRLLDNITELSAPGSQLATENLQGASDAVATMADRIRVVTEQWREHGFDIEMTDLWYAGDRNDVVEYLSSLGWTTSAATVPELAVNYGLSLPPGPAEPVDKEETLSAMHYITATRS
ncbi:class I SAM-dependent methyltransferase [Mycobacterium montefiorense]|uniref:S-adenosyl-L-methionine-dependent methyltransferase n=1 Tax=Mycobacterium montefiorense TaxID=154654 RepID=A0AA37PMI3_9MYCO|nr:class I SAM-dependent methyltransferase [Mycobacterium montefiorense]GBG36867.1 putative S-adenosyl-L-methionine-dependent methyltransferase [Mycobacterium montefiorense]GKU37774.1 putative S-adenosyl-L-methionine-dependent methyltransferase [Mycobacterium montefiorense]GKU42732.1 putative S-adenosyl-L-methionine-dependent methyltransferase [Mycobacterium montefiorense]GKU46391.1 putative S-adenosyl-L-methionine-dependent methyltransferase [Mycobacterium montefiorense]GKU51025.1 putative S-